MAKKMQTREGEFDILPGMLDKIRDKANNDVKIAVGRAGGSERIPLQLSNDISAGGNSTGKVYPGLVSFDDMRQMGISSTIVRSIVNLRTQQLAKLPIKIIPKEKEPTRQISILNYRAYDLDRHPAFDDADIAFLRDTYDKIDPEGVKTQKRELFVQMQDEFTPNDIETIKYLQEKHDDFYKKRESDIKKIKKMLSKPDPYFTNTNTWNNLVAKMLWDLLLLDRGVVVKIRDLEGNIVGLMPVDGASIRPFIYEYGFVSNDRAYVQVSRNASQNFLDKNDVIVFMMNPVTDMRFFGYGISPMETLYRVVLSDIYIDKGNIDYYRKGGTVPEIILNLEPVPSKEGVLNQISQSQLEDIQRNIQAIMTGDFTQVPIISGAKVNVTDLKGKRRDMQFKELAEYIIRKICAVFQVSSQEVNLLEGFKSSDGEVQAELTRSKGLHTLMIAISEFMTYEVLDELRPEGDLKLWFEEPEEKEADKQWGTQRKLTAGVLSINEVRSEDGLYPVPWGDTPLQNLQKNWEPPQAAGGMGGAPGALPGLPPMGGPGGPPMGPPGAGGPPGAPPGGAPGGAPPPSPFSGAGGPPGVMKSVFERIEDLELERDFYEDIAYHSLANDMYLKSMKMPIVAKEEDEILSEFLEYKGGEFTRTPIESYEYLLKSVDPELKVDVRPSNLENVLYFSRVEGDTLVADSSGDAPMTKTIAKALVERHPEKVAKVEMPEDTLVEALEYAVLKNLDTVTRDLLYKNAYNFKPQTVSNSQIAEVEEVFLK